MAYVGRNAEGKIVSYSPSSAAPGIAEEYIDDNDPELQAFLNPPPSPPGPYTLQMADFWIRFDTDEEYEDFDAAVSVSPLAKDRRAFNAATFLISGTPLFVWTWNVLVGVVGEPRAEVIMAASPSANLSAGAETAPLA